MAVSKYQPSGNSLGHFLVVLTFIVLSFVVVTASAVQAQTYRFTSVQIEGNQRVEAGTILSYADIARGEAVSAGRLNDAYQSLLGSGLFETVDVVPNGSTLVIRVQEFPTINRINIEGNRRLKDEDLLNILQSQPRRVYSPTLAEQDAATLTEAYTVAGRIAATVDPKIIRRSDNRVDLVFEVSEGRVIEIERLSFTGNRSYSDRRLRRVLETKQAGLFRQLIGTDTFIEDRIEFDKQVLSDFYQSRGYVDFETKNVNAELTRERDAFLIIFDVVEGQSFDYGQITALSLLDDVDAQPFMDVIKIKPGQTYSPAGVEQTIARMERVALQMGLNFIRVEPRVTRNDRDLTLDLEFEISRGPRVFVERIDIEGNNTTLDRVIRRKFKIVEGDPFNPREIRQSAERIRALGFFSNADVTAREGNSVDSVIVDVDVEETPTGQLGFGASYSNNDGVGVSVTFSERNFLGRGQALSFEFNTASANQAYSFGFREPALLGRDLAFALEASYRTTNNDFADYDTTNIKIIPSLTFPVSENGRLSVRMNLLQNEISDVVENASKLIKDDEEAGPVFSAGLGYTYSFDTRRTGLDPNSGVVFRFGQDFNGLGSDDATYIRSTAFLGAETKVFNEEVTLRAILEAGALNATSGNTRITDRFFGNGKIRGFEPNGIGPRDLAVEDEDALGGNMFAALRFEADFPLPLPEEYGLSGGVYFDVGSVWSLDNVNGGPDGGDRVDDGLNTRSAVGFSIFWDTAIGPLRFNFSNPLQYEEYDNRQYFDLTVSTRF
ncbi:outer membrane protein assembly factor BamA [Algirhabdus cladophorae]|uniref:outer membrane protein assembly factor BamA n=1 Tax=Algirhabdus cladophorae TaxID=3377108 RepID=UPI003B84897C